MAILAFYFPESPNLIIAVRTELTEAIVAENKRQQSIQKFFFTLTIVKGLHRVLKRRII